MLSLSLAFIVFGRSTTESVSIALLHENRSQFTPIIIHHVGYLLALGDLFTIHSYRYDHLRVTEKAIAAQQAPQR